jgi:hypothetical protein
MNPPNDAPSNDEMQVTIMYRNHWFGGDGWTCYPMTVTITQTCPVCGGPRGEPYPYRFYECGEWRTAHKWDNPCGHVDKYAAVLRESGYRQ